MSHVTPQDKNDKNDKKPGEGASGAWFTTEKLVAAVIAAMLAMLSVGYNTAQTMGDRIDSLSTSKVSRDELNETKKEFCVRFDKIDRSLEKIIDMHLRKER